MRWGALYAFCMRGTPLFLSNTARDRVLKQKTGVSSKCACIGLTPVGLFIGQCDFDFGSVSYSGTDSGTDCGSCRSFGSCPDSGSDFGSGSGFFSVSFGGSFFFGAAGGKSTSISSSSGSSVALAFFMILSNHAASSGDKRLLSTFVKFAIVSVSPFLKFYCVK